MILDHAHEEIAQVPGTFLTPSLHVSYLSKIHLDSCGIARNIRRNYRRVRDGCGLHRARRKRSGFLRFRNPLLKLTLVSIKKPLSLCCSTMVKITSYE